MKIEMQPKSFGLYRKPTSGAAASVSTVSSGKQDVIDFRAPTSTDKALTSMKAAIQSHVAAPSDPRKLEALRTKIESGVYRIDTDTLARAIMGSVL